jgi:hypothetical protein
MNFHTNTRDDVPRAGTCPRSSAESTANTTTATDSHQSVGESACTGSETDQAAIEEQKDIEKYDQV